MTTDSEVTSDSASETAALLAISPLDGRYASKLDDLRPVVSEFGLIRNRIVVELRWFESLAENPAIREVPALSSSARDRLDSLERDFSPSDAAAIRAIEARTNHDVKAVEYWLRDRFAEQPELARAREFIHFACTSEDINNLAYALMLRDARERILLPEMDRLIGELRQWAGRHADQPMLARTHGQPATPTTLGKELANVGQRLVLERDALARVEIRGKANGAVGNFAAHVASYPELDWEAHSQTFVESLGLVWNPLTTQIEPHDWMAAYCHALIRFDTVLLDFVRDVWSFISIGYFRQRAVAGEVGSSTMPHKVNPIDFENAEGNLGLANALLTHLAEKLPISRWQRDLSDSTVLRTVGVALGHALLAIRATLRGMGKLAVDADRLALDLAANPAVLAEAVQTVMRRYGIPEPYEKLKAATRGQEIGLDDLRRLIGGLELPESARQALLALTPDRYVGLAARQARRFADGK